MTMGTHLSPLSLARVGMEFTFIFSLYLETFALRPHITFPSDKGDKTANFLRRRCPLGALTYITQQGD